MQIVFARDVAREVAAAVLGVLGVAGEVALLPERLEVALLR